MKSALSAGYPAARLGEEGGQRGKGEVNDKQRAQRSAVCSPHSLL